MKVKLWQIAVIILGFLVGGGFIAYTLASPESGDVNYVKHYIDVETGDVYRLDTRKHAIGVPGRDPKGQIRLVRLSKKENGDWFVSDRDRSTIAMLDKNVKNAMIDEQTGDLLSKPKSPVDYPIP